MPELQDYDVGRPDGELPPPQPEDRPIGVWIAVGLLVVAAGIAAYVVFGGRGEAPPAEEQAAAPPEVTAPPEPLGTEPAPIDVPPLGESDPVVRDLVKALSTHPRVAAWLATDGLIRNFTTVVLNVAEGRAPAGLLRSIRPGSSFRVAERGDDLVIDPGSYERYNGIADAVASINPKDAARLYTTLKPRIEEAYGELGFPNRSFDLVLERAIVLLLNTPVPSAQARVEPQGIVYGFADEDLERLTAAQKQLLRMGPRNVRLIQRSLREIAIALGIPADRLPVPDVARAEDAGARPAGPHPADLPRAAA